MIKCRYNILPNISVIDHTILLTAENGMDIFIDVTDYILYKSRKWVIKSADKKHYYLVSRTRRNNKEHLIYFHRLLMNVEDKKVIVDHIDTNTLNNKRDNLRLATRSKNAANSTKHKDNKAGYRGVHFSKARNKWLAEITHNYKRISLGSFKTKEEAAKAYDKKAIELFGEFAYLNFKENSNE